MNLRSRQRCSEVIKACCYLYNFLLREQGLIQDSDEHRDFEDLDPNLSPATQLITRFNNPR
jgi:hypothetical protein